MKTITLPQAARLSAPNPVILVCTQKPDGTTNLATVSWWTYLSYNPNLVAFAMAKSSYSGERVRETKQVILSIPGAPIADAVLGCGSTTGCHTDKVAKFNIELSPVDGSPIRIPVHSRLAIVCTLQEYREVGDHYLYICRVNSVYGNEAEEALFAWNGYSRLHPVPSSREPSREPGFLRLAAERYSVRSFADRPIEPEKMAQILKAGQLAPTAVNEQPQKIYILKSAQALDTIRSLTRFTYDAPVVLLCCADLRRAWHSSAEPGYTTAEMDVSIVCTHMMLEAWEQGIGSVWVRGFDAGQVAAAFHLPDSVKPICLLPIGYPAADAAPYAEWHNHYRPLSDMVEEL